MIKNNFYPLRTIIGPSISARTPAGVIDPTKSSHFKIVTRNHPDISGAVVDDIYSNFLPDIIKDGITYHPIQGMNTMPIPDSNVLPLNNIGAIDFLNIFKNPSDIPFPATDKVSSIFGYQEDNFIKLQMNSQSNDKNNKDEQINHFYSGRDKSFSFFFLLEREVLVGGICFNGYPFISSRIENTAEGMTVGNFGLPREMRLTPLPSFANRSLEELTGFQRSQFIDSEFAYTRQEIISHSGLNYLTIDPVKTNLFMLTITDLPFIPRIIDLDTRKDDTNNPPLIMGFKGFAIPYIYFFEYKEQTRHFARLHSGLLGVKKTAFPHLPGADGDDTSEDILRRAFPEYEYYFSDEEKNNGNDQKTESIETELAALKLLLRRNPQDKEKIKQRIKELNRELKKLRAENMEAEQKTKRDGVYWLYTAHSALGQRREFTYDDLNYSQKLNGLPFRRRRRPILSECYVSDLLLPNEKVTLYLQQGEEFERCVAGLKALFLLVPDDDITKKFSEQFANLFGVGINDTQLSEDERTFVEDALALVLSLPTEINFCEEIGLKIYEVDPIEGVSPASVDLKSKYATLLADTTINDFMDVIFSQMLKGIPFRRTSSSKYFAIELTNKGQKAGQVAIHSLQMIRSANISIQPRPAKTQQVKALHYRMIGPKLADDFSRLGTEGFNFSIDRVTAGQTKNVLYSAMSLLDLLHTGGARIQSNVRRRAIEYEKSIVTDDGIPDSNFERRKSFQNSNGWRSNETGKDVNGDEFNDNSGILLKPTETFESYGNQESRVNNESLFPRSPESSPWKFLRNYLGLIDGISNRGLIIPGDVLISTNDLEHDWLTKQWKGFSLEDLKILGTNHVSTSPFTPIKAVSDVIEAFGDGKLNFLQFPLQFIETLIDTMTRVAFATPLIIATGGGNASMSISPGGIGVSFGIQPYPNFSHAITFGTSGNITKQAFETRYSFNQLLSRGADVSEAKSLIIGGEMKRIITRQEVPNTDKERVRGAEVMWQDKIQDIITGSIPLDFTLPATATKMNFRTADDALRVRFNSGFSPSIEVDFWFELTEETIKDDN
jgi:hypothetical protein